MENIFFAEFPAKKQISLAKLCQNLLDDQKNNWPRLAFAQQELANVRTRCLAGEHYEVTLQFNPQRAISSGAAVDKESIAGRPCFLCTDNLPPEQKGILYSSDYLILCNPAPFCSRHFTIVHRRHQPQSISSSVQPLLNLACDLAPDLAVFYNGPACGASAPDHLHFQAITEDFLPITKIISKQFRRIKKINGVNYYRGEDIDREVIVLEGEDRNTLQDQFHHLMDILQKNIPSAEEPLINIICTYRESFWRLIVFLRSKHRPDSFYEEGEKRIFVSPGAVDMAGTIITPQLTNFQRLDFSQISSLYREVSAIPETATRIMEKL